MNRIVKWFFVVYVQMLNKADGYEQSGFIVSSRSSLKVYWNIPTFQCKSFKLNFTEIADKYGIIQNENDNFRGSNISILYDPGYFPALINESGKIVPRNGGIPQNGKLQSHLKLFQDTINDLVPNENFSGLGIIDFESWRPIFRQNFGVLSQYKSMSIEREKMLHPFWPTGWIEKEAQSSFETYAKLFMEETLILAGELRPNASWGYYAYPYCFNKSPSNTREECPKEVQQENDRLHWLFSESNILLPSIYLGEKLSSKDKKELIEGRINEAHRVIGYSLRKQEQLKIFPYFWYKYHDSKKFLTKEDLKNSFSLLSGLRIDGLIIWGSSNDVNSKSKCQNMFNYFNDVLGPILINTIS